MDKFLKRNVSAESNKDSTQRVDLTGDAEPSQAKQQKLSNEATKKEFEKIYRTEPNRIEFKSTKFTQGKISSEFKICESQPSQIF